MVNFAGRTNAYHFLFPVENSGLVNFSPILRLLARALNLRTFQEMDPFAALGFVTATIRRGAGTAATELSSATTAAAGAGA